MHHPPASDPETPFVAEAPFHWDTVDVDFVYRTAERTITQENLQAFCDATGLTGRLFTDPEYARAAGYAQSPVPGALVFATADGLVLGTQTWHGTGMALLQVTFQAKAPTHVGDTIHAVVSTTQATATSRPDRGLVGSHVSVRKQDGTEVMTFDVLRLVRTSPEGLATSA